MIRYIYATKNRKSENFNAPQINNFPKDNAVEEFTISVKEVPEMQKEAVKELDFYYLGTFDTRTGVVVPVCEYLFSADAVLGGSHGEEKN